MEVERKGVVYKKGTLLFGAGGLISVETFIVQLQRTFVSLYGFSFHNIFCCLYTGPPLSFPSVRKAFMVCQSPTILLIALHIRSNYILCSEHTQTRISVHHTEINFEFPCMEEEGSEKCKNVKCWITVLLYRRLLWCLVPKYLKFFQ